MKIEKAHIEYSDSALLQEVVKWYNNSHRNSTRSCELELDNEGQYQISVIDKSDLIPFGIYDVGLQIGFLEMNKNFRIKICRLHEIYKEVIHKSKEYPKDETFTINNLIGKDQAFKVKIATGINSSFGTVIPYLNESDLKFIVENSNLQKISPTIFETYNSKSLNYFLSDSLLFLFGTDLKYGKNYYEVELDSIYEIEIPQDDF